MYECVQLAVHGQMKAFPDWILNLIHVNHFALASTF